MKSWNLRELETPDGVRSPIVLDSSAARAILIELAPGEELGEHEVHEHTWVTVISGEVVFTTSVGDETPAASGTLVAFDPAERHSVIATSTARLLLLLAPWPAEGHDPAEAGTAARVVSGVGRTLVDTARRTTEQVRAAISSHRVG
jgi:quercetin dioxygenase-like cupin family protein